MCDVSLPLLVPNPRSPPEREDVFNCSGARGTGRETATGCCEQRERETRSTIVDTTQVPVFGFQNKTQSIVDVE